MSEFVSAEHHNIEGGGEGGGEGGRRPHLMTEATSSLVKVQFMILALTALELRLDAVHWIQFGMKPILALSSV